MKPFWSARLGLSPVFNEIKCWMLAAFDGLPLGLINFGEMSIASIMAFYMGQE